jgi:integrase
MLRPASRLSPKASLPLSVATLRVVRQVAADFPQFADLSNATPYAARHTFMSCCLQAGLSLATIAGWCGTSIQMISETYGRMIRRYEGA